jgi:hypothetical protein
VGWPAAVILAFLAHLCAGDVPFAVTARIIVSEGAGNPRYRTERVTDPSLICEGLVPYAVTFAHGAWVVDAQHGQFETELTFSRRGVLTSVRER